MSRCLVCGKEGEALLCPDCRAHAALEPLCVEIATFSGADPQRPLWNTLAAETSLEKFRALVFDLSKELPASRRDYVRVLACSGGNAYVVQKARGWFLTLYPELRVSEALTEEERRYLDGLALQALRSNYDYTAAERIAEELHTCAGLPWQTCGSLAEFYTLTRRYALAQTVLDAAMPRFAQEPAARAFLDRLAADNAKRWGNALTGRREYLPNPRENSEAIRQKYLDFLAALGIPTNAAPAAKTPRPLPRETYPAPVEVTDPALDTFVAFDLETTGLDRVKDSIIEIGAVKVVGGQVIDTAAFTFQELVRPLDGKTISPVVQGITGLSTAEVYAARPVWEVLPDFLRFAGDAVLLGFNCMSFDSLFMVRAGRYSKQVITNPYFDVMHYAKRFQKLLKLPNLKLATLSDTLHIENPRAHRALADALTTARVFLALRALEESSEALPPKE